jgi:hypothetical protein
MPQEITPQDSATVDHSESRMARADLYRAAKNAMKLFELVHTGQELEGWVQAKITKAADYLDSVYHYMEYQAKFGAGGTASSLEDIISDASMPAQKSEVSEEDDEQMRESMNYEQKLQALLEGAKQKAMMKKKSAKKDEKVEEGFPTVADAKARAEKQKTTGKFDKKELKPGVTQYTRKASTFTDGGDDSDTKKAKQKSKSVKEGAKPDYIDADNDGDEKESMKQALADKKAGPKKGVNPFAKKDSKVKESDSRAPAKKKEREVTLPSGAKAKSTTVQGWQSQKADKSANKERKDSYKESAEVKKEVVAESADLTRLKALTKKLLG